MTNAEKMIEETKEAVAKTQLEIKKEFQSQSESLQKRLADRRKRIAVKNSMNNSMSSDMMSEGGLMSSTNAGYQQRGGLLNRKATLN